MTEGYTPTRIRTEPMEWPIFSGHLTAECAAAFDGGPACPMCLAWRLPPTPAEHRWPWRPKVGPGALEVPVPTDHADRASS